MSSDNVQGLESLEAWKRSKDFAVRVCTEVLPLMPVEEKWSLSQQIRRSVQSVPANIAEGHGRYYYQETIRFCYIARGSLSETHTHLTLAHELGYLPLDLYTDLRNQVENLARMINGYIAYLKRAKIGAHEPGAEKRIAEPVASYQDDLLESCDDLENS